MVGWMDRLGGRWLDGWVEEEWVGGWIRGMGGCMMNKGG